jgi:hypothetical protein
MTLSPDWHDMNPYPPEEWDECPNCGQSLGDRPREHRCER